MQILRKLSHDKKYAVKCYTKPITFIQPESNEKIACLIMEISTLYQELITKVIRKRILLALCVRRRNQLYIYIIKRKMETVTIIAISEKQVPVCERKGLLMLTIIFLMATG